MYIKKGGGRWIVSHQAVLCFFVTKLPEHDTPVSKRRSLIFLMNCILLGVFVVDVLIVTVCTVLRMVK
jgi:hypothetical protein